MAVVTSLIKSEAYLVIADHLLQALMSRKGGSDTITNAFGLLKKQSKYWTPELNAVYNYLIQSVPYALSKSQIEYEWSKLIEYCVAQSKYFKYLESTGKLELMHIMGAPVWSPYEASILF